MDFGLDQRLIKGGIQVINQNYGAIGGTRLGRLL